MSRAVRAKVFVPGLIKISLVTILPDVEGMQFEDGRAGLHIRGNIEKILRYGHQVVLRQAHAPDLLFPLACDRQDPDRQQVIGFQYPALLPLIVLSVIFVSIAEKKLNAMYVTVRCWPTTEDCPRRLRQGPISAAAAPMRMYAGYNSICPCIYKRA